MNLAIERYGWGQTGPFPSAAAELVSDSGGILVRFDVREPELRAVHAEHNGMVCEDSCVEFFVQPFPDDPRYVNVEVNPIGTVRFELGAARQNRLLLPERHIHALRVRTGVERVGGDAHWTAAFRLSYALIAQVYGRAFGGGAIRCNLYKCGDLLRKPHWGTWAPIATEQPDFHRPEYFASVSLEG
jgi:hypothetical protein